MPCYLFTFHAYRSWMPNRARGYVRREHGVLPPDLQMAKAYTHRALHDEVSFDETVQQLLIEAAIESCECQECELYFVATETTHVHILVGWRSSKDWKAVRRGLRSSLSRKLTAKLGRKD
jgi:hypothetical protein